MINPSHDKLPVSVKNIARDRDYVANLGNARIVPGQLCADDAGIALFLGMPES